MGKSAREMPITPCMQMKICVSCSLGHRVNLVAIPWPHTLIVFMGLFIALILVLSILAEHVCV